jgi:hypothetical protein
LSGRYRVKRARTAEIRAACEWDDAVKLALHGGESPRKEPGINEGTETQFDSAIDNIATDAIILLFQSNI